MLDRIDWVVWDWYLMYNECLSSRSLCLYLHVGDAFIGVWSYEAF